MILILATRPLLQKLKNHKDRFLVFVDDFQIPLGVFENLKCKPAPSG
jgi:hypothetical protein